MARKQNRLGVRSDQVDIYGRPISPVFFQNLVNDLPAWTDLLSYVGGTEQLLPVNDDEPETSPILCDIQYPDILRNDQYFTYRKSPTTKDGLAKIRGIRGNTLVWNQLEVNNNTTGSSGGITYTNNGNGSWTVSNTSTTFSEKAPSTTHPTGIKGHKYLFIGCPNGGAQSSYMLRPVIDGTKQPADKRDYGSGIILECTTDSNPVYCLMAVASGVTVSSQVFYPQVFDLTQMFGSGNEPTIEEFKSLFPLNYYAYNSGSLLNFNGTGIKTTGRNLFDGTIYSNNHAINSSGAIYSTTSYKVYTVSLPVGDYVISATNISASPSQALRIMNVDSSLTKLTLDSDVIPLDTRSSFTFSVPSGTAQTLISIYNNHTDVQLEVGSTATSYEPYTSSTLSLPISTYFPTGMKSVGSVYDELTPTKAITRIGAINLGEKNWTKNNGRFNSTTAISDAKGGNHANCKCALYVSSIGASTREVDKSVCFANNGYVYIYDTSFTGDADAFKTAMSGVYLFYELATPVVEATMSFE